MYKTLYEEEFSQIRKPQFNEIRLPSVEVWSECNVFHNRCRWPTIENVYLQITETFGTLVLGFSFMVYT